MSKFYSLSIDNDYVSILDIESDKKSFTLLDEQVLEIAELEAFLETKKSVYFSCDQEFIIDEQVKVPAVIKNKSTIKNYILHHFKKANPLKQILFNYKALSKQSDEENTIFQVDGVDEIEYSKSLQVIKNWEKIKSASLSKFALLAISNQCIDEKAYISVYTSGKKILILAIHEKKILFSRSNIISSPTPESLQLDMTAEINQTISYIQQQYRDIKFTAIVLSGQMAIDDRIAEQLLMLNTLPICILYPNYLVKNIQQEEGHSHILSIGNLFIPKEYQFFPTSLLGLKQFKLVSNILLTLSTLIFLTVSYFTLDEYSRYSDLLDSYKTIKNRLLNTVKRTKTLSQDELDKSLNHLNIAEKHLKDHPSDIAILLKPLISLLKPISWEWNHTDAMLSLDVKFEKDFTTLSDLHDFEMQFNTLFDDINTTLILSNIPTTNYKKLHYKTEVKIISPKKNEAANSHRRRVE